MKKNMEKYETLKEAFEAAFIAAEGYPGSGGIPIYKNSDGTFEIGGFQSSNWSDIGDGTFTEIGKVVGWRVEDVYDSDDYENEKSELIDLAVSDILDVEFEKFCEGLD